MQTVEFDADGKILGRLATQIAEALRGKNSPQYRPDRLAEVTVIVKNIDKIKTTGNKEKQKLYYRFSGYPGGLKKTKLEVMRKTHPDQIIMLAVKRMLPPNKLRDKMMKHLVLEMSS